MVAAQVSMQAALLVGLFCRESRNMILAYLHEFTDRWLPELPGFGGSSPAKALGQLADRRIMAFKDKVAIRAAATTLDTRCAYLCKFCGELK